MIRGIQIIGVLIGLFFLYQSYRMVKDKKEDVWGFILWVFIGSSIALISIFPDILDYLLGIVQMQIRAYAIFTLGILFAYFLLFQLFRVIRTLNENMSKFNENLSILRYEIEEHERKGR